MELLKHSEHTKIQVKLEQEEEKVNEQPSEIVAPSFKGRLNLSSFTFRSATSAKKESASPSPSKPLSGSFHPSTSAETKKRKTDAPTKSPSKRAKSSSGYAPPSTYAHLPSLPDRILPNLIVLFVGLNPGIRTSTSGHAYAHPSNLFWKLLESSGITPRRCHPSEDVDLPRLFALGNTNIVARPTRNGAELSKKEMDEGVAALEEKIRIYRPEVVCIVGKSIFESIWRVRHGGKSLKKEEFHYGWQDDTENMGTTDQGNNEEGWKGAKVFAATSTSGLAANLRPAEKESIWRELGQWVEERRHERNHIKNEDDTP